MNRPPRDWRTVHFTLPEPPSANRYWRHVGAKVLLSEAARTYRGTARIAYARETGTLRVAFPEGTVAVTVAWYRGRKSGDLDNRIKQLLDAMKGVAFTDDSQVTEIHAYRFDDPKRPRADLTITRLTP